MFMYSCTRLYKSHFYVVCENKPQQIIGNNTPDICIIKDKLKWLKLQCVCFVCLCCYVYVW